MKRLTFRTRVVKPVYSVGTRKYIDISLPKDINQKIVNIHKKSIEKVNCPIDGVYDPLSGNVLKAKMSRRLGGSNLPVSAITHNIGFR